MLSIIRHASPSFVTFMSKTTTTGFAKEATDTPELFEESWIAFSQPHSPCSEMQPFTTRRDAHPKRGASNDSLPRRFLLTQAWGVHPAFANGLEDLVVGEFVTSLEGHGVDDVTMMLDGGQLGSLEERHKERAQRSSDVASSSTSSGIRNVAQQ